MSPTAFLVLQLACCNAYQVALLRATPHAPTARAIVMSAGYPYNSESDGKSINQETYPESPAGAYKEVDVSGAADELLPMLDTTPAPAIDLPEFNVDLDKIEDAAISAFKFLKRAFEGAVEYNEKHDIVGTAKHAVESAVEFERKHEIALKTRAIAEMGAEQLSPMIKKAGQAASASAKASKEKATIKAGGNKTIQPSTKRVAKITPKSFNPPTMNWMADSAFPNIFKK